MFLLIAILKTKVFDELVILTKSWRIFDKELLARAKLFYAMANRNLIYYSPFLSANI